MKFFIAVALFAAVASARIMPADISLTPAQIAEVDQILTAIQSPSTDPTTAAMLEQMLLDLLGVPPAQAPVQLPATIDFEPIHVGPAIIDFPLPEGALEPTPVAPAPEAPAAPAPSTSPLVQIIVNVKHQGDAAGSSPVVVDNLDVPMPVAVVEQPAKPEIKPTPVMVVEEAFVPEPAIKPTPVVVVEDAFVPQPEPVIVSPVIVAPAVVGPDTLN